MKKRNPNRIKAERGAAESVNATKSEDRAAFSRFVGESGEKTEVSESEYEWFFCDGVPIWDKEFTEKNFDFFLRMPP